MWEMLVLGYVLTVGGSFVGAEFFPRARKFFYTVGVLVAVVPVLLFAIAVIMLAHAFQGHNLHIG
jgi:hypothetical protein